MFVTEQIDFCRLWSNGFFYTERPFSSCLWKIRATEKKNLPLKSDNFRIVYTLSGKSRLKIQIYQINLEQTFSVDKVQVYKSHDNKESFMQLFSFTNNITDTYLT